MVCTPFGKPFKVKTTCIIESKQFYWGKSNAWLEHKKMHSDGIGMPIENWRVVDIDNLEDWKRAEILSEVIDSN